MKAIATLDTSGFRTEIKIGDKLEHSIIADEPAEQGGQNDGPSAFGLLAAALGA